MLYRIVDLSDSQILFSVLHPPPWESVWDFFLSSSRLDHFQQVGMVARSRHL